MTANRSKVDDWLKEEYLTPPPQDPQRRVYDDKAVAWIDILGMRNMIKDSAKHDAEAIFAIMEKLRSFVSLYCDKYVAEKKFNYLQIADGFIITAELSYINELFGILSNIQWHVLVECNMLLRGAVSAGKVTTSEELIIGPAYIQAFELEDKNAIFPRIIISQEVIKFTKGDLRFAHIAEDTDKQKYLHFLDFVLENEGLTNQNLQQILTTYGVVKYLRDSYIYFCDRNQINLVQKYGWMISQLKSHSVHVF